MREQIIRTIVDIEWEMFQKTQNVGGRAWCQDDRHQFESNRLGQFRQWDEKTLSLYLGDLQRAECEDTNLVAFKYAYMMEHTYPEEFLAIREQLPDVSAGKKELIMKLTEITLSWCEEFRKKYPGVSNQARPIYKNSDGNGVTSVETYFQGESATYSKETLESLLGVYERAKTEGRNLYEQAVVEEIQLAYGKTLSEIEKLIRNSD